MRSEGATPNDRLRRLMLRDLVVVATALFIGGLAGAVVASVGQLALRRAGPRAVAGTAAALLVLAALSTARSTWGNGVLFDFGRDHALAAAAGQASVVLLLVAVVEFASQERRQVKRSVPSDDRDP